MSTTITPTERLSAKAASARATDFIRRRMHGPRSRDVRWVLVARVDTVYIFRQERNSHAGWRPAGAFHVVEITNFWGRHGAGRVELDFADGELKHAAVIGQ